MKKTLFSRSNSVILLILLLAALFIYLNQFTGKTNSLISNELQYQVFVELPRENFRRVILDQFPIKYSFVDKHENIFFKIKSNNEDLKRAKNVKISIWTNNRNSFEIRQYPEPVDKYLKKVRPLEHGYLKYDVLSDLVDGELTYVLVSIPGEKIEIREKIER